MSFFITLQSVLMLFILMMIGYVAGKKNLISPIGQKEITNMLLYITLPATIINAMIRPITPESIHTIRTIFIIVILSYIAMFVIASLMAKTMKEYDAARRDVMLIGAMQYNAAFMGFPVVLTVYGEEVLFYVAICHTLIFEFFSWFIAINVLERNVGGEKIKFDLRRILLRPGIMAIMVGLLLFVTQTTPPKLAMDLIKMLGAASSPVAMIVVGVILSRSNLRESLKNKYIYIATFFKLLFFPIAVYLILKAIPIDFGEIVMKAVVIEFAMPSATYLVMMSQATKNDAQLASQQVFVSSLFSVLTIPIIVFLISL